MKKKYITTKMISETIASCDEEVRIALNLAMLELEMPKRDLQKYIRLGCKSIMANLGIKSKEDILRKAKANDIYA